MIHHYTTIDNLALILESGKIRFTRLDLLDDIKEVYDLDNPTWKFDKAIFISSWTEDEEENIPLWKMYASVTNGVRITMSQNMFRKNLIKGFEESNHGMNGDIYSPLTKEEHSYNDKYLIINDFSGEDFYKKVDYKTDPDIIKFYRSVIKRTDNGIEVDRLWDLGKIKNKKWAFQKEVRFTIYTKSLNPKFKDDPSRQYDAEHISQWFDNPDRYIDVPLAEEALKNMTITLAPCVSDAQRVIVKSLIQTFKLQNTFKESELKGYIRK